MPGGFDEQPFLKAVCDHPDDDLPRLVFADWLDEHGDPDRAEFIRLQCAIASGQGLERWPDPTGRERALLEQHAKEWEKPLRELRASQVLFRRGFPASVGMYAHDFTRNAERLFQFAPIRELSLRRVIGADDAVCALVASPHLVKLSSLDLGGHGIGPVGARALAESPHLANLTSLNLRDNYIDPDGARALAKSPHLANLTSLDLGANGIGPDGAHALAASPHLANLTSLNVRYCGIGSDGALALAESPYLAKLRSLNLRDNHIGPDGARALAASPHLGNLTSLNLADNDIGTDGARALVRSPRLTNVTNLDLSFNDVGSAVLREVAREMAARVQSRGQAQ